jgi:hypothetical protein
MSQEDDESVPDLADQVNRPADVALSQQRIAAWHPILDPEWMIYSFLIMAMILIPVGKFHVGFLHVQYCSLLSGGCARSKAAKKDSLTHFHIP